MIGWVADGPRPDPAGPAVVLGHVDSASGPGVFYPRAGLNPSAGLAVQRAGGRSVGDGALAEPGIAADHVTIYRWVAAGHP